MLPGQALLKYQIPAIVIIIFSKYIFYWVLNYHGLMLQSRSKEVWIQKNDLNIAYLVRMRENTDQKNSEYWHSSRSSVKYSQCFEKIHVEKPVSNEFWGSRSEKWLEMGYSISRNLVGRLCYQEEKLNLEHIWLDTFEKRCGWREVHNWITCHVIIDFNHLCIHDLILWLNHNFYQYFCKETKQNIKIV